MNESAKMEPSSGTGEDKYLVPAPDGEDSLLKNLVDTCGSNEEKGARRGNNPSAKRWEARRRRRQAISESGIGPIWNRRKHQT
jgi:hypothetical protein